MADLLRRRRREEFDIVRAGGFLSDFRKFIGGLLLLGLNFLRLILRLCGWEEVALSEFFQK